MAAFLLLAKLILSILFLVAAVGKLLGGFANSRKSLTDSAAVGVQVLK